jgi:hypothetical protein
MAITVKKVVRATPTPPLNRGILKSWNRDAEPFSFSPVRLSRASKNRQRHPAKDASFACRPFSLALLRAPKV